MSVLGFSALAASYNKRMQWMAKSVTLLRRYAFCHH